MPRLRAIPDLNANGYRRHRLHADDQIWVEKNCYIDVWIELIHALGMEPLAVLPFTIAIDFDGDQWTFFKPPHDELRELYGLDVQELNVWRPLLDHVIERMADGRFVSTEADAFWLPDTAGTDYRRQHTKSTIITADIDVDAKVLGYFHNAGYFELSGEDFDRTFRIGAEPDPTFMPLFAETVKRRGLPAFDLGELRRRSCALWRRHLMRLPDSDPVRAFQTTFERKLADLSAAGLSQYHAWAFATTRQLGAATELAAINLEWLAPDETALKTAIDSLYTVSRECKTFILKAARAVSARKTPDWSQTYDTLATSLQQAKMHLRMHFL